MALCFGASPRCSRSIRAWRPSRGSSTAWRASRISATTSNAALTVRWRSAASITSVATSRPVRSATRSSGRGANIGRPDRKGRAMTENDEPTGREGEAPWVHAESSIPRKTNMTSRRMCLVVQYRDIGGTPMTLRTTAPAAFKSTCTFGSGSVRVSQRIGAPSTRGP